MLVYCKGENATTGFATHFAWAKARKAGEKAPQVFNWQHCHGRALVHS